MAYNKKTKNLDHSSRNMFYFDFLEKGLIIVSPPRFVCDISRKFFPRYIYLSDQISLSDCLYVLRYWANMCITIVC